MLPPIRRARHDSVVKEGRHPPLLGPSSCLGARILLIVLLPWTQWMEMYCRLLRNPQIRFPKEVYYEYQFFLHDWIIDHTIINIDIL